MWNDKAKIEQLNTEGRRMLVISDIHANLPYFKALLAKAALGPEDILILDGDFLEKGAHSLETLRYIMQLSKTYDVHPVCGNCDTWVEVVDGETYFTPSRLLQYMRFRQGGLCWDMFTEMGIDPNTTDDIAPYIDGLRERFAEEWAFLRPLPQIIETPHYIFTHGGICPDRALSDHSAGECMKLDAFMEQGYRFDKWVIVGHWPVMLYLPDRVCANPIIDRESRIISLDGGCVLKDDGQLNALIIPCEGSEDFDFIAYDPFPVRRVKSDQSGSEKSYYIRWGDNLVTVLERGGEFSLCRHKRTGYEMRILTKYLYTDEDDTSCNDCTDLVLSLQKGDEVSVVECVTGGYLVKHNGTSGWYWGELE